MLDLVVDGEKNYLLKRSDMKERTNLDSQNRIASGIYNKDGSVNVNEIEKIMRGGDNAIVHTKAGNQGESQPLSGLENNIKENTMSDLNEDRVNGQKLTPREMAFRDLNWQRTVIMGALRDDKLSCLPGKDGYADTEPAFNRANDTVYQGINMLYLKQHALQNGFPTAEYATSWQVDKAKEDNPNLHILKGQKGVTLHFSQKDKETGEFVDKSVKLFNVAQLSNTVAYKKWADNAKADDLVDYLEYKRSQHGDSIARQIVSEQMASKEEKKGLAPEIECSSTEPAEYIGQYLAAVSMGGKFKASAEQAKEFKENLGNSVWEKTDKISKITGEATTDPFKLLAISREANKYCKEFTSNMLKESRKQKQEQTQELSQKINRGR